MIEAALDTVSLHHAIRLPKKAKKKKVTKKNVTKVPNPAIDDRICSGRLRIAVDRNGALLEEYRKTCGAEAISVFIPKWGDCGGIKVIDQIPSLPQPLARKLVQLGFRDAIDKLVLKLSTCTRDLIAVSDDGDFWDPRNSDARGNNSACVAQLVRDELNVRVMLLRTVLTASR